MGVDCRFTTGELRRLIPRGMSVTFPSATAMLVFWWPLPVPSALRLDTQFYAHSKIGRHCDGAPSYDYSTQLDIYFISRIKLNKLTSIAIFGVASDPALFIPAPLNLPRICSKGWFIEEHRISDPELAAISEKVQSLKASGRQTLESLDA